MNLKIVRNCFIIICLIALVFNNLNAQEVLSQRIEKRNGKFCEVVTLAPVYCTQWKNGRSESQLKELRRMVCAVKRVYPYAKEAGRRFEEYDALIAGAKTKTKQQSIIKKAERDLVGEYKQELQRLSLYQGRILIKLIDREIGKTPFQIIKEFRGGFISGFYRTLFAFVGLNVNAKYDPKGKDKDLEYVVVLYERGYL